MENNALARIDNVSFRYPKSVADALSGVSLEIPRGSFFALLGPNGAGKTTLLRLLCGRFAKFSGTIDLADDVRGSNGFLDMLAWHLPETFDRRVCGLLCGFLCGAYTDMERNRGA